MIHSTLVPSRVKHCALPVIDVCHSSSTSDLAAKSAQPIAGTPKPFRRLFLVAQGSVAMSIFF